MPDTKANVGIPLDATKHQQILAGHDIVHYTSPSSMGEAHEVARVRGVGKVD
jgi:hypothetical protein